MQAICNTGLIVYIYAYSRAFTLYIAVVLEINCSNINNHMIVTLYLWASHRAFTVGNTECNTFSTSLNTLLL